MQVQCRNSSQSRRVRRLRKQLAVAPSPVRMPPAKRPAAKAKQALTEEQKQEIREAFDLFDTDGSGALRASAPTMSCGVPPRSRARTLRAPRRTVCHRYDRRQGAEGASTSSNYTPSRRRERPHPAHPAPERPPSHRPALSAHHRRSHTDTRSVAPNAGSRARASPCPAARFLVYAAVLPARGGCGVHTRPRPTPGRDARAWVRAEERRDQEDDRRHRQRWLGHDRLRRVPADDDGQDGARRPAPCHAAPRRAPPRAAPLHPPPPTLHPPPPLAPARPYATPARAPSPSLPFASPLDGADGMMGSGWLGVGLAPDPMTARGGKVLALLPAPACRSLCALAEREGFQGGDPEGFPALRRRRDRQNLLQEPEARRQGVGRKYDG